MRLLNRRAVFFTGLFLPAFIFGQQWEWGKAIDFPGVERYSRIGGLDKQGNVYLAVEGSSVNHNNNWSHNYLLKMTASGDLLWQADIDRFGRGRIVTDTKGATYVTGWDKIAAFGPDGQLAWEHDYQLKKGFGTVLLHPDGGIVVNGVEKIDGINRPFISRYSPGGNLISTVYDHVPGLMSNDGFGHYYLATTGLGSAEDGYSATLYKYDGNGLVLNAWKIPHSATQIISHGSGDVFVTGWHDIFPLTIDNTRYSTAGYYLVKYDSEGNHLWHKHITPFDGPRLGTFNIDADGNLYYIIPYSAKLQIDDFAFESTTGGFLLVKFSPDGKMLWHMLTPSSNTGVFGFVHPEQVQPGVSGEIFISGAIFGTLQIGPSYVATPSDMYSQLFVGKIDGNNLVGIIESNDVRSGELQLFPNPSGHAFSLSTFLPEEQRISYKVLDIQGICLLSAQPENAQGLCERYIDLGDHPKGVYFLEVWIGEDRYVRKLVRN